MITGRAITKVFFEGTARATPVLRGVDLNIKAGASYVVLGRSGVGKSVLLRVLLGLTPMTSGELFVKGISVRDQSHRDTYLRSFGMLFQGGALFDSMTVLDNVAFPLIERGMPRAQALESAREKLAAVGLEQRVSPLFPSELSGGMQKRAALARAIALHPDILLFDEPTTGLDPVTGEKIISLLKDTIRSLKTTTITITHDLVVARALADHICLLEEGVFSWQGSREEFEAAEHPLVVHFRKAAQGEGVA
ncbi:MAG: ATP-binding cassette domain-containing protein [Holosporales bacterium]|nr:ATP-binding cassette domain-containing protein [Holosporales bacterium]